MKIAVLQEDLAKALSYSARFINPRAQLPILGNVMLVAKKQKLGILATNLEVSLSTTIGAKVDEEGDITVPAKTFFDLINNLKSGTVTLETKKEQLTITSDHFSGKLMALNSNDFPKIPQTVGTGFWEISVENLVIALEKVLFAASIDETRPILTGILFWFRKKELILASSDGFRLSRKSLNLKDNVEEQKIVLPKSAVQELVRILAGQKGEIKLAAGNQEKQVIFGVGDSVFTSRVLEGNFPDFEKIIPKETQIQVSVDKEETVRAIKSAAVFAREAANIVKLAFQKGKLTVSAESQRSGQQSTELEAKVEGGEVEITYNYRFLEEFLNLVSGEDVEIKLNNAASPGIFIDPKDTNFLHLIMPVKIQD